MRDVPASNRGLRGKAGLGVGYQSVKPLSLSHSGSSIMALFPPCRCFHHLKQQMDWVPFSDTAVYHEHCNGKTFNAGS